MPGTFSAHRSATLACLMLATCFAARAQMPGCLRFGAPRTLSCGDLHAGQPMVTPRPQYAPWKALSLAGQSSMRYLVFSGVGQRQEPLFRRNGVGEERTAQAWLASEPGVFFFDSRDASDPQASGALTPPITIHLRGNRGAPFIIRGFAYFNAHELRLVGASAAGASTTVRHASEPFFDLGIDLDHDGVICAERGPEACCPDQASGPEELTRCNEYITVTNSRWDVELDAGCDPSKVACASDGPMADEAWPPQRPEWDAFVAMHAGHENASQDPRMLPHLAHEPFLQWGSAASREDAGPIRWSFARESSFIPRQRAVHPSPWGATSPGYDRADGDVVTALSLQGVIYNEGRVVLGDAFAGSGAVYSGEGVIVSAGAELTWSSDFARPKFPPAEWKGLPDYCR